ncbi:MAG: transposase [Desulfotomaculum sp.]|nr:transposase [Desulfotomaculum sp.]
MGEARRTYTKEFKKEAVELLKTSGKSAAAVARDLGINVTNLRRWRQQFQELGDASFPGQGNRKPGTPEEEEIRRLKRELEIIKEERDILKKAVAIFSKTPR